MAAHRLPHVYSTVANAGDLIDVNSKDITLHADHQYKFICYSSKRFS